MGITGGDNYLDYNQLSGNIWQMDSNSHYHLLHRHCHYVHHYYHKTIKVVHSMKSFMKLERCCLLINVLCVPLHLWIFTIIWSLSLRSRTWLSSLKKWKCLNWIGCLQSVCPIQPQSLVALLPNISLSLPQSLPCCLTSVYHCLNHCLDAALTLRLLTICSTAVALQVCVLKNIG